MSYRLPDASALPGTRVELLTLQRDRVKALEKRYFSIWRTLKAAGWLLLVFVIGFSAATLWLEDASSEGARAAIVALFVAVAAVASWRLLAHAARGRVIRAEALAWHDVDRSLEARALPAEDIPIELATIHDARDRADLEDVILWLGAGRHMRLLDLRLALPSLLATPALVFGPILLLLPPFFDLGAETTLGKVVMAATGLILSVPAYAVVGVMLRESWRRQKELNRGGVERDLYRIRRSLLTGEPVAETPRAPLWANLVAVLVFLVLVLLLMIRIAMAEPVAIVATLVILGLAAVVIAIALIRRHRSVRVLPLLSGGATILDAPSLEVAVDFDGSALHIRPDSAGATPSTIATADILAVVPVELGYPFAPEALGIITRDAPIVLFGRGVDTEPALAALCLAKQAPGRPADQGTL